VLCNRLLPGVPYGRIPATSREALRLAGEVRFPLDPLPTSPRPSREEAGDADAVRLFVARAKLANPGRVLGSHDLAAVRELVAQLDGLPLAIELAAAATNVFTPRQLLGALDERMHILANGHRGSVSRQRSLGALIDWSYDLL